MGEIGYGEHHQQGHQYARKDACQKQRSNAHIGHHAVNDERQTRWNDGTQSRRCSRDAHRKLRVVAMVFHGLDLNGAQARRVGNGGAAHAGKNHRANHIDMAQPTLEPADQGQRVVVNPVGDARVVHQVAGQNEKGHRQQRKAVDAADHAVNHHKRRVVAGPQDVKKRRARHGNGHRHATRHQDEEDDFEHEMVL